MKKFFNIFFVVLGVIFLILIIGGFFFYIGTQFGGGPSFSSGGLNSGGSENSDSDQHPYLSPAQESALRAMGIDPASVPTSITPEQESCFADKLGQGRVEEIKGGDTPTPMDYYKAKSCI